MHKEEYMNRAHTDYKVTNILVIFIIYTEHIPPKAEVTGSNPVGCANLFNGSVCFPVVVILNGKHMGSI